MSRRRRHMPQDLNLLAILVVVSAFVLAVLDKIASEAFLTLVAGLAIPAKATGYQDANPAAMDPHAGT